MRRFAWSLSLAITLAVVLALTPSRAEAQWGYYQTGYYQTPYYFGSGYYVPPTVYSVGPYYSPVGYYSYPNLGYSYSLNYWQPTPYSAPIIRGYYGYGPSLPGQYGYSYYWRR